MLRWVMTGLIFGVSVVAAMSVVGSSPRPNLTSGYFSGLVIGRALSPLLIGLVLAWLLGFVMKQDAGALHRRTNWIALLALILSTIGSIAQLKTGSVNHVMSYAVT